MTTTNEISTCSATTKAGNPCRNRATAGETCRRHAPEPLPEGACGAVNDDGSQCRYNGVASDGRCNLHTEDSHTVIIRYSCGHTASFQKPGGRPSDWELRGGDIVETPDGWETSNKYFACTDCEASLKLRGQQAKADCPHTTRHIQDGDIICADCHSYLGTTDVPVQRTLAQAQAVYDAPYQEPVCPAHEARATDCGCHSCMAQTCDCQPHPANGPANHTEECTMTTATAADIAITAEPLPLTARREVRMPSERILSAGAEDAHYYAQLPAGWVITGGVHGSACDGRELLETEYIGRVALADILGTLCQDTSAVRGSLSLEIWKPADASGPVGSISAFVSTDGRYQGPINGNELYRGGYPLSVGERLPELMDPAIGYINDDDILILVSDVCHVCEQHTADLRADDGTNGICDLVCLACYSARDNPRRAPAPVTRRHPAPPTYHYRTIWSDEDGGYIGLCDEYPSLSWFAGSPEAAFGGIRKLVEE